MATVVDSLMITLGLDSKGVQKGMDQAQGTISAGLKKITSILGPVVSMFAIKSGMDNFAQNADKLGKTAERLGVDVQDLDAWGQAAQHCGGSAEAFQSTVETLNSGLQTLAATGSGRCKAALGALGIEAKNAAGEAKQPFEILEELAQKAGEMDAAQFAGLAKKLGIDQGTILLLQQGGEKVDDLVKKMRKMAYTKEDTKVAEAYNDAMQDMGRAMQKVATQIFRVILPAFTWLAEKFTDLVQSFSENKATVVLVFTAIGAAISSKVIPAIKAMDKTWMKSSSLMTISAIVAGVTALYLVLDDFLTYLEGGDSAFEDFWAVFGTGEEIMNWFTSTLEWLKTEGAEVFNALVDDVKAFFSYFEGAIQPLKDVFFNLFALIKAIVTKDWDGVVDAAGGLVQGLLDLAVSLFTGAFNLLGDALGAVVTKIRELFGQAWDWVASNGGEIFSQLVDNFVTSFSNLGSLIGGALQSVYETITEVLGSAWDWVKQKALDIFNGIVDFITGIFSRVGGAITGAIKSIVSKIPDFLLPDKIKAWANSVDDAVQTAAPTVQKVEDTVKDAGDGMVAASAVTPKAQEATRPVETTNNIDSHSETTVNVGGISVTTQATDPQGTADATAREIRGLAGMKDGAVQNH